MKVTLISCYFATSYGAYASGLRCALERRLGADVEVLASNCGCGDPVEINGQFHDRRCSYFAYPNVPYWKSSSALKQRLRNTVRGFVYGSRARRFAARTRGAEVVHFQQTLNAFGGLAVFKWLAQPTPAARVVTVHELAPYQLDVPASNLAYNTADRILVHAAEMRDRLVELGVRPELIGLIEHGVDLAPMPEGPRSGIVFYGGHFLFKRKGFDLLLAALKIVKAQLGARTPTLTVHGHYGTDTPEEGTALAAQLGVGENIRWLNQVPLEEATRAYASAAVCVLPYQGSFAGFPASLALANGVPVIATRCAGLPEHLGPAGVFVDEDPAAIAAALVRLLDDPAERARLARAGRERAERVLSWDRVAEKTLAAYETAIAHRAAAGRAR